MAVILNAVPFVALRRWRIVRSLVAGHNLDVALCTDLYASDMQTGGDHGLDSSGQVALTKSGRAAGHCGPSTRLFTAAHSCSRRTTFVLASSKSDRVLQACLSTSEAPRARV